jgi:hypothetical protein
VAVLLGDVLGQLCPQGERAVGAREASIGRGRWRPAEKGRYSAAAMAVWGSGAGRAARGEVFLVLATLAANLHCDVYEDDVDDHSDAAKSGDQADILAQGCACEKKHAGSLATAKPAGVVAFRVPPPISIGAYAPGEVPERLNGRDWKSRNGGNFVRGFESPPLRHFVFV